ncbi:MAG: hypothetical protein JRN21_09390 [Nitrososphaerota archaeon]|nr:hypothetical protein [Nitrososphaerota archaeon]
MHNMDSSSGVVIVAGALCLIAAFFIGSWIGGILFTPMGEVLVWQFLILDLAALAFLVTGVGGVILIILGLLP